MIDRAIVSALRESALSYWRKKNATRSSLDLFAKTWLITLALEGHDQQSQRRLGGPEDETYQRIVFPDPTALH